jgi:5'-nucleotidase
MDFSDRLVIGVSSRALFDLEEENRIYETQGVEAYIAYQHEHENEILRPGTAFPLVKAFLRLNELGKGEKTEIIIMSRNSADTSIRIFNSLAHYNLNITRAALTGGSSLSPYLSSFSTDLFLSACEEDVQYATNHGIAAGIICASPAVDNPQEPLDQIRIAFDGDAVLFSDESEHIYKTQGIDAFQENERKNAQTPLHAGPFAKFLKALSELQKEFAKERAPIRTALVTARNAPAHERVIRTLRAWDVRIDEAFFLGGMTKREILQAFGAHIFFDDQKVHLDAAEQVVPSARVPYIGKKSLV